MISQKESKTQKLNISLVKPIYTEKYARVKQLSTTQGWYCHRKIILFSKFKNNAQIISGT